MNKNEKHLASFTAYCVANPNQRFFQALRNWMRESDPKIQFVLTAESLDVRNRKETYKSIRDTFYWEEEVSHIGADHSFGTTKNSG
jgi:hypothetical protein